MASPGVTVCIPITMPPFRSVNIFVLAGMVTVVGLPKTNYVDLETVVVLPAIL
jgi:hypothetical protein